MNIKKIVVFGVLVASFAFGLAHVKDVKAGFKSFGGYDVPMSRQGDIQMLPEYWASKPYIFNSTTEAVVCTGNCIIDAIMLSSGAVGSYAIIRDTATADGSGTQVLPVLQFEASATTGIYQSFPLNGVKVMTTKGITVDLSTTGNYEVATIWYRDLD